MECSIICTGYPRCRAVFTYKNTCFGLSSLTPNPKLISTVRVFTKQPVDECNGWDFVYYNGLCMLFIAIDLNWFEARTYCENKNSHLLVLDSELKVNETKEFLNTYYHDLRSLYVGASDETKEGEWKWVTKTKISGYFNFQPGQPNNINSNHPNKVANCGAVMSKGELDLYDVYCYGKRQFICEIMATSLSQEDINFLRLAGLLIRVAPHAVRRKFDYEFHPKQLKQFLCKNRRKIYDLTFEKGVITLVQYDLLYPKGSSKVSSDKFDVSLMVCLLRNFTDLDIQDSLPMETIHTDAADISRIKFYRNSIVHSDSGKVDENKFSEIWKCVAEAILRLAPDIKPEIDALISSSLTNVTDIIDFLRLEKQLEKTNQHMVTINRKLETLEIEKNNITEIQLRTLKEWRNTDKKYIHTSATTFIQQSLNQTTGVIITGSPGCGKSAVAHHVALELERRNTK
ncbi:uncharacterized protein [Mytilus edulis]|uniref:uncharacterized protein n=1 Tax=Mytilus edulis TaxID=6550 RepID=UPI0039EED94B